ncbi:NAD(P)H-binding protein [Fructobacillus sp. W13]|uniref:NAD(P)H-binding protein n=1 Tax=Fructobacillus apis TaxID=2935017 RepID=A0ABT0ZND0_9LACO|nr:NAD(P)H-binding protein [Fructobacillus apis]MCO0831500.1 NAD(P)H-binding protein [Fructobacillus apis]
MANVLVIGAHGRVGHRIVEQLIAADQNVFAGYRDENQFETTPVSDRCTPVLFDLDMETKKMVALMTDYKIDQVIFTAGAGGKGGDARTTQVDLDGAVKTMEATKQAGLKRYLMVSAAGADDRNVWVASGIYTYFMMKHYADMVLQDSDLDYTILRPTTLTDDAGAGSIQVLDQSREGASSVSRNDVAKMAVAALASDKAIKQVVEFTAGETPIDRVF